MDNNYIKIIGGLWFFLFALSACDTDSPQEQENGNNNDEPEIQDEYVSEMDQLSEHPRIQEAFEIIEDLEDQTIEDLITITEIPAPPFMEDERAEAWKEMVSDVGIDDIYRDEEGNVIGIRNGTVGDRVLVLSAHLDTVFPEDVDVTVEARGDTLYAPGIGDDSRGLAVVLTVLRAMNKADIQTEEDIWIVGTVGEEGLGDLRGVKHLFREDGPDIDYFITVDGGGETGIANKALGSHRYRVEFSGPGGHSWGAFGEVNPAHALARAIHYFDEAAAEYVAEGPRTSYNIGRIGGGTSINSIPYDNWFEVDMRSIDQERLNGIDDILQESIQRALEEENARRDGELEVDIDMVGNRPSGEIDRNDPLVQRSMAAISHFGFDPRLQRSSTDANVPISLGVPAVRIGRGGVGGNAHSVDEWWLNKDQHLSIQRTLLITLAQAGLAED